MVALFLVVLMSIESFAATVTDNDGAAFITKAEYDSLKNGFQERLNSYNASIDSKIDSAIASYLAGVKKSNTSIVNFYDGLGQKVLIFDSSKTIDIKRGKVALSFIGKASWQTNQNNENAGLSTLSQIKLGRETYSPFEVFALNNGKFKFYNDNYNFKISATELYIYHGGYTPFYPASGFYMRWHGSTNYYGGLAQLVDTHDNVGQAQYSYYFDSNGFWQMGCSGFLHCLCWTTGSPEMHGALTYDANTELLSNDNKINFVMDRAVSNTTIWSDFDNDKPKTSVVYSNHVTNYNNTPSSDYEKTLPTDAGVVANGWLNSCSAGNPKVVTYYDSMSFVKNGLWNSESTPTNSYRNWIEPTILLSQENPKTLVHSAVTNRILNDYSPYGWTGKITEGLPIGIINKDGEVRFKINTSSLTRSSVFAISTTPFSTTSTQHLIDTPLSSKIEDFTIDGIEVSSGAKEVTAKEHTIKFKVKAESGVVPVFFKIEFPQSDTTSIRKSLTLPNQYEFTVSD